MIILSGSNIFLKLVMTLLDFEDVQQKNVTLFLSKAYIIAQTAPA